MKTFIIKTLGCKVNQFESESIAAALIAEGWGLAGENQPADLCVVNTCTVTSRGAMQSRQTLRRLRREHPGAMVLATGCYATLNADDLKATGAVDVIVHHRAKYQIARIVQSRITSFKAGNPVRVFDEGERGALFTGLCPAAVEGFRTRAFLRIQDGCNAFCAYCIVPHARGPSQSMAPDRVLDAVEGLAAEGRKEVVLAGIHLGLYGADLSPPLSLPDLLETMDRRRIIPRVRLSSIEPRELTDGLLDLAARSGMICDHFHMPLQSGSDPVLKRMGRPYTAEFYANRVAAVKKRMPCAAIGADVLVGFPGEDQTLFEQTFDLIRELPLSYLHVFPFSPRPGTPAFDMEGRADAATVRDRCAALRELGAEKKKAFCADNRNRELTALVEETPDRETGLLKAVTANYLSVLFSGPGSLKGRLVKVRIGDAVDGLRVTGTLVSKSVDGSRQVPGDNGGMDG
ncbi:MAG: tRNA (N(6)-L-threonylcarbamoyladenosine(37)-C(2))-methylthiotransferase MtaB [Thermodesulfobacteriota bacterium]